MEYRVVSSVSWQQRAHVWCRAADDYTHLQACSGVKLPADISGWFLCGAQDKSSAKTLWKRFFFFISHGDFIWSSVLKGVVSLSVFFFGATLLRPNSPQSAWLPGCRSVPAIWIHGEPKLDISLPWHAIIQWMWFAGILGGCHDWHLRNPILRKLTRDMTNHFVKIMAGRG